MIIPGVSNNVLSIVLGIAAALVFVLYLSRRRRNKAKESWRSE